MPLQLCEVAERIASFRFADGFGWLITPDGSKWLHYPSSLPDEGGGCWLEPSKLAPAIHLPQNAVQLPPYRCIRFERHVSERVFQPVFCSMNRWIRQVGLQPR